MKKFFFFLFTAMLCIGFTGCVDGDDHSSEKKADKIVGTWNNYKDTWNNGTESDYYEDGKYGVCFKENGSGYWTYYGEVDDYFDWEISGSTLRFDYGYGDYEVTKIKTLKNNELVLSWEDDEEGDYLEYYERIR